MDDRLAQYRATWGNKPVLRAVYQDYYRRIVAACKPGKTLEIGGGSGNFKGFARHVVSTDILSAPWLDLLADAQHLPFAADSFDNIVMFDVLHHLENPCLFLSEATRVLRSRGRLVLLEPAITPLSWVFYKLFHPEPIHMNRDPLAYTSPNTNRDPYDSNQAISTLLFGRYRHRFEREFQTLRVREYQLLSLFAYPLSGGFQSWSLLPMRLLEPLLHLEDALLPFVGRLAAFRLLGVVERQ